MIRKMKKINFLPTFIPLILSEEKTQTRRCIKHNVANNMLNAFKNTAYKRGYIIPKIIEEYAPFKKNEILYIPEPWMLDHVTKKGIVTKSSMESASPSASQRIVFNSAESMPKEYAKIFIKIVDIKIDKVQNIGDIGLHKEGIRNDIPNMLSEPSRLQEKIRKFKNIWNSIYNEPFSYKNNPYVWVYTFERVNIKNLKQEQK